MKCVGRAGEGASCVPKYPVTSSFPRLPFYPPIPSKCQQRVPVMGQGAETEPSPSCYCLSLRLMEMQAPPSCQTTAGGAGRPKLLYTFLISLPFFRTFLHHPISMYTHMLMPTHMYTHVYTCMHASIYFNAATCLWVSVSDPEHLLSVLKKMEDNLLWIYSVETPG